MRVKILIGAAGRILGNGAVTYGGAVVKLIKGLQAVSIRSIKARRMLKRLMNAEPWVLYSKRCDAM